MNKRQAKALRSPVYSGFEVLYPKHGRRHGGGTYSTVLTVNVGYE